MSIQTADGRTYDSWQELEDAIAGPGGSGDPFDDPSADTTPGGGTSTGAPGPSTVSGPSGNGGGDSGGATGGAQQATGWTAQQMIDAGFTAQEIRDAFNQGKTEHGQAFAALVRMGQDGEAARAFLSGTGSGAPVGGAPTATATPSILAGREADVAGIIQRLRNNEISKPDAVKQIKNLLSAGTDEAASAYINGQLGEGFIGDGGTNFLNETTQPTLPTNLGDIFGGETGGIGLPDLARQFTSQTGITPGMRGFLENLVKQQDLPFALSVAQGGGDIGSGIQDPQAFTNFLGQQGFSPIGQTLRGAADFLRQGSEVGQGQDFIRNLLEGPSGSVGSEFLGNIVGLLSQNAGRRFLPGLGQTARTATSNALNRFLANNPQRFGRAEDFIDFLGQERFI